MARERISILDATAETSAGKFPGLAYRWLEWKLGTSGVAIESDASQASVVLVTHVSAQEHVGVRQALKRHGIEPDASKRRRSPLVILGGQAAMLPAAFDGIVDGCCVGEGESFLNTLLARGIVAALDLPNAWIPGDGREVIPDELFPWESPPAMGEDGYARVYASRGCRHKCLFCQTGWQSSYRVAPESLVLRRCRMLRRAGHKINLVTNDAADLPYASRVGLEHASVSYRAIREIAERPSLLDRYRGIRLLRIGVEAPSTRMRRFIGKPIRTEDVYRATVALLNRKIGVRWFLIAGLPGERDDDYGELREVIRRCRHDIKSGALQLSFTAFCPEPATPLGLAPLDDSYGERYVEFERWFFREMKTHRVMLFKCQQPRGRLAHAIGAMAADEGRLRRGWGDIDPPTGA